MSEGVHNVIDEFGIMLKSIKREFDNVSDGVRYLMLSDEQCRNDDLWLQYTYARAIEGIDIHIPRDDWYRLIGLFKTIERVRRKIQEDASLQGITKLLPTDPEVIRQRRIRCEAYRKLMPNWHPNITQDKLSQSL